MRTPAPYIALRYSSNYTASMKTRVCMDRYVLYSTQLHYPSRCIFCDTDNSEPQLEYGGVPILCDQHTVDTHTP